ncbi:hypothetical protein LX95_00076 [Mesonia algae]|uniref:DinB family protein n=1 Tax=Mesonia algae TaxID=213248 RepID=A0A2W7IDQ4_9FLAO|nr:DinB family protein [Mesonia algae]PZW43752.1 hypothetical protein LX95_00076 [Mesonia algae]
MKVSSITTEAKLILLQLVKSINLLTLDEYTENLEVLSCSTIGQHSRHVIELFQQLSNGYDKGSINYDKRNRDIRIQNNIDFATECIAEIIKTLNRHNKKLQLISLYDNASIETNYYRELIYNIEHCIHHQAMLKIGLNYLGKNQMDENYGVAKSTQIYKQKCVQ